MLAPFGWIGLLLENWFNFDLLRRLGEHNMHLKVSRLFQDKLSATVCQTVVACFVSIEFNHKPSMNQLCATPITIPCNCTSFLCRYNCSLLIPSFGLQSIRLN